jgi:methyl-accepting chemotaxis protein
MSWKNMTIGKKIGLGFGFVLALLIVVGVASYTGIDSVVRDSSRINDGNKLIEGLAQKEIDHLNWVNKVNALLADDEVKKLDVETDDHKCGFGKWLYGEGRKQAEAMVPGLAPMLKEIEAAHHKLHASAIKIGDVFEQADAELPSLLADREIDHLKWATRIRTAFLARDNSLDVQTDAAKCALGKWLDSEEAKKVYESGKPEFRKQWDEMVVNHKKLHETALGIKSNLAAGKIEKAEHIFNTETTPLLDATLNNLEVLKAEAEHSLADMKKANKIYITDTIPALHATQALLHKIREGAREKIANDEGQLNAGIQNTKQIITIVGVVAVVAGILLAFLIARGIISILRRSTSQIDEGARQVVSASTQVASASQSLAEGASEQAASIEETSSSLEEMSSMTKQNADNANQADAITKETGALVARANESMSRLTASIEEISAASQETSKIIKTIDEIAFQTNLLALNAAVEAARAGEAGAGFAVVADEVRNLAMRAAEAAKNTTSLIEGTVAKVNEGAALVEETNEAFSEASSMSSKTGDLVAEIAAASSEQAQGIDQVNKAIAEMDKVTQHNAANAEESASAAEEMNAQAEQMKSIVADLAALVDGHRKRGAIGGGAAHAASTHKSTVAVSAHAEAPKHHNGAREISPGQMIPLDEDSFKDF